MTPRFSSYVSFMRIDPLSRAVAVHASTSRPAPAAIRIAAHSHTAAAVFQPMHRATAEDDAARTENAYAGDDLGCDARRVQDDGPRRQDVAEPVLADQQDRRRRDADDRLRSQPGGLALYFAFEADQRSTRTQRTAQ
jgi:hypothetical protein